MEILDDASESISRRYIVIYECIKDLPIMGNFDYPSTNYIGLILLTLKRPK